MISRELGDRAGEGLAIGGLGNAYQAQGLCPQAHRRYEQHLAITRELGDRRGEVYALDNLGMTHYLLGNLAEALARCEASLVLAGELGDRSLEGTILRDLANVQAALGRTVEADTNYVASLSILDEIGDQGETTRTRWAYGQFLIRQGKRVRGIALLGECVAYEQRIGHAKADEHAALVDSLRTGGELPA